MADMNDFPARGRVRQVDGDRLIFLPAGTNYELHLKLADGAYTGPIDQPVEGFIRLNARKLWTVPSGGNFVSPIFGPPKIVQGRVKWLDTQHIVVHAGTNFLIEVPFSDDAIDLANGAIEVGSMVNVTAPGGTFALKQPVRV